MEFEFIRAGKAINIEGAELIVNEHIFIEEKYDGSRFGLEKDENGNWHAWSRNGIDRANNIPYIFEELEKFSIPNGTVLDGEVIQLDVPRKQRWEAVRSVMGTKEFNTNVPKAQYLIFDIQRLGGKSFQQLAYLDRREALLEVLKGDSIPYETTIRFENLALPIIYAHKELYHIWDRIIASGGEGIMLKDNRLARYGKDWIKVKKEDTVDCFIIGATKGKGKYEGQIGALELAVMNGDTIWPIGKCSGMTDSERREMTNLALKGGLKGLVCEVKYNEVTKNKKLRHPRFVRWRTDKPQKECKLEQLL